MVTIPTIDQISGTTVMNKMRSLIRNYIDFAEEIADSVSSIESRVEEMYTKEAIDIIVASIDARIDTKQDILISGTNIKTVDGKTILGSGNVEIDFSNFYTKTEIDTIISNYYNKSSIDTLMASKQDLLVSATNIKTVNGNSLLGSGNLEVTTDLSNYYTKSVIDTFLASKQDTLVSGTNIKTVNGNSLLGSGDITVGASLVTLVGQVNTITSPQTSFIMPSVSITIGDWFILEFNRVSCYFTKDGAPANGVISGLALIKGNTDGGWTMSLGGSKGIVLGTFNYTNSNVSIVLNYFIPSTENVVYNGIATTLSGSAIKLYKINI